MPKHTNTMSKLAQNLPRKNAVVKINPAIKIVELWPCFTKWKNTWKYVRNSRAAAFFDSFLVKEIGGIDINQEWRSQDNTGNLLLEFSLESLKGFTQCQLNHDGYSYNGFWFVRSDGDWSRLIKSGMGFSISQFLVYMTNSIYPVREKLFTSKDGHKIKGSFPVETFYMRISELPLDRDYQNQETRARKIVFMD